MKLVLLLVFALCIAFVSADLPVHCVFDQIVGDWKFSMTQNNFDKTVIKKCPLNGTFPVDNEITVSLSAPNVASFNGEKGTFTLIYDEGFEVTIAGRKFFAFFNYTKQGETVTSHCDRTFTGWFHNTGVNAKNWGCFRGVKLSESNVPMTHTKVLVDNANAEPYVFKNDAAYINKINNAQKTWTAAPYPAFEGLTGDRLIAMGGQIKMDQGKREAHMQHVQTMNKFRRDRVQVQELPDSFDWRNVSGVNYVSPVRNQASCGSCYIFAAMAMFEARVRIMTKNADQRILSTQETLACSDYSQKCDGGFPYLISKYAEDFGLVNEECNPYVGRDTECPNSCQDQPKLYGTNYTYIGGYYGAVNEPDMRADIYKNGPIVVGFQVYRDLYNYKSGVYQHVKVNDEQNDGFEEVNHAVTIVGWGVTDDNVKYWIVKNSWGTSWGNQGYFLILRGSDECAIESLAVSAIPVF